MRYELWLTRLDISNKAKNRLSDCMTDAKSIYNASREELLATNMIDETIADKIIDSRNQDIVDNAYRDFGAYEQKLITRSMTHFPEIIKPIKDSPYGLYYIGNIPGDFSRCVAIVGARNCSEYGRWAARELGYELAKRGYIIVSGMAYGVDNAAHEGALEAKGVSIAVLGCGVENCYPRKNINTYMRLQEKGAIISELYPGTKPMAYNFPLRNRIITGLCNQVIIIEAREQSGSLISADYGLEQGKDVYAIPGRITDSLSTGCNRLIAQGAGIITSISDFINSIEEVQINTLLTDEELNCQNLFLEKDDLLVYSCLDFYPKSIDDIVNESKLNLIQVLASLMNICEANLAKEAFVNQYVRIK